MDPILVLAAVLVILAGVILYLISRARKPEVISITIRPPKTRRIQIAGNEGHIWQNDDGRVCLVLDAYEARFIPVLDMWADDIELYGDFAAYWSETERGRRLMCLVNVNGKGEAREINGVKALQWSDLHHAGHGVFQLMGGEQKGSLLVGEYEIDRVMQPVLSPLTSGPYGIALARLARHGGLLTVQVEGGVYRPELHDGTVAFRPIQTILHGAVDAEMVGTHLVVIKKDQNGSHSVSIYSDQRLVEGPHETDYDQISISTSQVGTRWINLRKVPTERPHWDSPSIVFWPSGTIQRYRFTPAYNGKGYELLLSSNLKTPGTENATIEV